MKETIKIAPKQGYVFNEASGKLESFEFIRCVFALSEDIPMITYCKLGGADTELQGDFAVYDCENSFKTNCAIKWIEAKEWRLSKTLPNYKYTNGKCWTFNNGRAELIDITSEMIEYADNKYSMVSGQIYYHDESEVYKHHDIVVKKADGSEQICESIATKMKFSDAQKSAILELKKAIGKATELGITLTYDIDYGALEAYNSAIGSIISSCESEDGYIDCHSICESITNKVVFVGGDDLVQIKLSEPLK